MGYRDIKFDLNLNPRLLIDYCIAIFPLWPTINTKYIIKWVKWLNYLFFRIFVFLLLFITLLFICILYLYCVYVLQVVFVILIQGDRPPLKCTFFSYSPMWGGSFLNFPRNLSHFINIFAHIGEFGYFVESNRHYLYLERQILNSNPHYYTNVSYVADTSS